MRVAVAEGTTVWQVVEALKQADFLEGQTGPLPSEGTLAPDTYEVEKGGSRSALLAEMAARQSAILAAEWEARPFGLPYQTPEEALTMASIVEKETGIASERPDIAGVFTRRLQQGMLLQTDPTVIYGMGERYNGRITRADLREPSPYNTYLNAGLPPTPIAMPGKASLMAAVQPAQTKALYFVARGDGSSHFSGSLDEHNRAVNKYQRGGAVSAASAAGGN